VIIRKIQTRDRFWPYFVPWISEAPIGDSALLKKYVFTKPYINSNNGYKENNTLDLKPMNIEFVNPFLSSLVNVLSTMAQTDLTAGKPCLKKDNTSCGDVSGLIGMVGPQTKGSLSITFDESLALDIMQKMLGESSDCINDDVTDMVGEITNMVSGGAKNILGDKGYQFVMATPIVVTGKVHTLKHKGSGPKILIPFSSASGKAYIEICFDKQNID